MNIRKIIREEIDSDWAFMGDINPYENVSELKKHFESIKVTIKDTCECSFGGITTKEVESNFLGYLETAQEGHFYVIFLMGDMGFLDVSIDSNEVSIKHFYTEEEWEKTFEVSFDAEAYDDDISEEEMKYFTDLIPDIDKILKGTI
jgi:hypothetical protein